MISHDVKKGEGVAQIVCVVFNGLDNGLADSLEASKVDDKVNSVLVKDAVQCIFVVDVCLVERKALGVFFSHNGFDAVDNFCRSIGEVVNNDSLVAGIEQLNTVWLPIKPAPPVTSTQEFCGIRASDISILSWTYIVISIRLFRETLCVASARVSRQVRAFWHCEPNFHYARLKSAKNLYFEYRFFDKIRQIHSFFYIFRQNLPIHCRKSGA